MSYLGLDIGEKRIGVARSDELHLMAHAVGFIERKNDVETVQAIQKYVDEFSADQIVVGLPKTMKGESGTQAEKVLAFIENLQHRLSCPMVTWDERLSTVQAERALLEQDVSRAKRRLKRDAIAAAIVLQSYLDFKRRTR